MAYLSRRPDGTYAGVDEWNFREHQWRLLRTWARGVGLILPADVLPARTGGYEHDVRPLASASLMIYPAPPKPNMKITLLWIAAVCVFSAAGFYGGMCRAAYLINYSRSECHVSGVRIDMLKAGRTAEAIALEAKILDAEVGSLHRSRPLGLPSPLFIFSSLRDPEHRDLLFMARDMHAQYPDLAFRPESLAVIAKFEEKFPYDSSAASR